MGRTPSMSFKVLEALANSSKGSLFDAPLIFFHQGSGTFVLFGSDTNQDFIKRNRGVWVQFSGLL